MRLKRGATLFLSGASWWDEVDVHIVQCFTCPFTGIVVGKEERRGSLDSDGTYRAQGYLMEAAKLKNYMRTFRLAPTLANATATTRPIKFTAMMPLTAIGWA
jgi:hypothetical protein